MTRTRALVSLVLLVLTFSTATLAGISWLNKDPFEPENFASGVPYGALLILVLLSHACGHGIAARIHNVETSFPLLLPFPSLAVNPFGTLGVVTRLKGCIPSRKSLFDIEAAGALSGFAMSVVLLAIGFRSLPPREYLLTIHPEYANLNSIPVHGLTFGSSLVFAFCSQMLPAPNAFIPPMNEIYHYPFLCVGWLGLLMTSLHLMPVGPLDGGSISYCMFGERGRIAGRVTLAALTVPGLSGLAGLFGLSLGGGWYGWLVWAFLLWILLRSGRGAPPNVDDDSPLNPLRFTLGAGCGIVLLLCFSPSAFIP